MAQQTTKHPDQLTEPGMSKAAPDNAATIALLEKWAREDATNERPSGYRTG